MRSRLSLANVFRQAEILLSTSPNGLASSGLELFMRRATSSQYPVLIVAIVESHVLLVPFYAAPQLLRRNSERLCSQLQSDAVSCLADTLPRLQENCHRQPCRRVCGAVPVVASAFKRASVCRVEVKCLPAPFDGCVLKVAVLLRLSFRFH